MGKDLHPSILSFFKSRLNTHQAVESIEDISNGETYMFKVKRKNGRSTMIIVLSDCYYFGEFDYLSKPTELDEGGFILIAKPEASFSDETQINEIDDKIIIGKIGILLGALNKEEYWKYSKPKKVKEK
jgi:hypothetical protein